MIAEMTREEIDLMFGLLPEKYHKDKKRLLRLIKEIDQLEKDLYITNWGNITHREFLDKSLDLETLKLERNTIYRIYSGVLRLRYNI